jgi:uncharacterized protein YndB with AHSA1/START domain
VCDCSTQHEESFVSAGEVDPAEARAAREIVTAGVVGGTRDRVFRALADPHHLARWWGPKGFTNTFHEFDLRPGGTWRIAMHGPDGASYQNKSVFVEVLKPERIVLRHVSGPQFQLTIALAEQDGRTRITWRMLVESAAECERVKRFAVEANEDNQDRLEVERAKMA